MNTNTRNSSPAAAEQTSNNTTGWIGHLPGEKHIIRGQTFIANAEGDLQSIEIYSNIVTDPGKVLMTVHTYDPQQKSWGPVLASSSVDFNKKDAGTWVKFNIPGLHLNKDKAYGFKVEANESLIGMGEAAGSASQPLSSNGQEWKFSGNGKGDAYSYFSLAFRVGLCA